MEFNYSNPEFYEADEGFPKLLAEWVGQGYLMEQNKMEPPGYWLLVLFYLWNLVSVKVLWVNLKNTYSNGWEIFLVILKCGLLQKLEMLYWISSVVWILKQVPTMKVSILKTICWCLWCILYYWNYVVLGLEGGRKIKEDEALSMITKMYCNVLMWWIYS